MVYSILKKRNVRCRLYLHLRTQDQKNHDRMRKLVIRLLTAGNFLCSLPYAPCSLPLVPFVFVKVIEHLP
jgi:hypothetical protein